MKEKELKETTKNLTAKTSETKKLKVLLDGAELIAEQRLNRLEEYEKEIASSYLQIKSLKQEIAMMKKSKEFGDGKLSIAKELNEILTEKE